MPKKPKTAAPKTGVDGIIDYLNANRAEIGALVVGVAPYPGEKLKAHDGDKVDATIYSADATCTDDPEALKNTGVRSVLVQGLTNIVAERILRERGFFG